MIEPRMTCAECSACLADGDEDLCAECASVEMGDPPAGLADQDSYDWQD